MTINNQGYLEIAHKRAVEKKTHVSFPQLKYPSLRDDSLKHPVQWLAGKALDDNADGLWRVHNGIYDLTRFISQHPGGAEWLQLTKGTDITEAFECHHINPSVEKLLQTFYIRDATTPRNSPFTFKEDGFYRTLKNAVRIELRKIPPDVSRQADLITDGLLLLLLISSALSCWNGVYFIQLVSYIIASLSLAGLVVASHNYIHRKNNWRMYLFNLSLWSYRDFRVSHAISHHLYPNTLMDLEVSMFEPFVIWNPRRNKPLSVIFVVTIEVVTFPCLFVTNFIKRFILACTMKGFFTNHCHWHDGVGFLLPLWMKALSSASLLDVAVAWLWIICTSSFIFAVIGTNAAHHHPKIFSDGDEVREPTVDWGMHELEAVMDRTDVNGNLFKVMTLFGDHALHHLFPTLDHAVLNHLYPVFLSHCEKFRANFRMTSSLDLFIGQILCTKKREPNLLEN